MTGGREGYRAQTALLEPEDRPRRVPLLRQDRQAGLHRRREDPRQTLEPAEVGHRVTSLGHLGQIAIQVGGKLKWDPQRERFTGCDAANAFLDRPMPPYHNA